jgi:hypothetical protein
MGQGNTPDEAWDDLHEARELYIKGLLKRGLPVPPPQGWGEDDLAILPSVELQIEVLAAVKPVRPVEELLEVAA